MVAERGDTRAVVRALARRGDRRTCWRQVEEDELRIEEVRGDGPIVEGPIVESPIVEGPIVEGRVVRATVGLVRVAEPNAGRFAVPARGAERARYRLIVQMHGTEERMPAVVLDVVVVTLVDHADGPIALQDARRGKLVERIQEFIESHLGDPELSPAAVAAAHHISVRYLHKLFEPEAHGVAGLIRQQRLERCRHDLLDPAQVDRPVAGIAARWGFSSAAHFSRVFRETYGLPPAEFRRAYGLGAAS